MCKIANKNNNNTYFPPAGIKAIKCIILILSKQHFNLQI